jgi:hypothetical protein
MRCVFELAAHARRPFGGHLRTPLWDDAASIHGLLLAGREALTAPISRARRRPETSTAGDRRSFRGCSHRGRFFIRSGTVQPALL